MTSTRPTALIKTVQLYNGNYGGVMQAWALQRVLETMGVEAWTDVSNPPTIKQKIKDLLKPAARRVASSSWAPAGAARFLVNAELDAFVRAHVRTVDLHRGRLRLSERRLARWDAVVVGSDQVWRPAYTDVPSNLLDFATDLTVPKVAYAASFGTSDLANYSDELAMRSRDLAQRFSAISVRELSGIGICQDSWGVAATHVLDPTLLLRPSEYGALIERRQLPAVKDPYVYDYALDRSDDNQARTSHIAQSMGLPVREAITPEPPSAAAVRQDPSRYVKQPVEAWLRGFRDAEFVVTDSFHGTIFSILFERPFVSILNASRGGDRFVSLLDTLGLRDRLVYADSQMTVPATEPDWASVRERLDDNRLISKQFLSTALEEIL